MQSSVYLSYAPEDAAAVEDLKSKLTVANLAPLDRDSLPKPCRWQAEVARCAGSSRYYPKTYDLPQLGFTAARDLLQSQRCSPALVDKLNGAAKNVKFTIDRKRATVVADA